MQRVFTLTTLFVCLLAAQTTQGQTDGAAPALRLTLREAVERALAQNPDVQIANLSRVEAQAGVEQARSQLLPQVGIVAVQRRQTSNLQGIGLAFPGFPSRIGPFNVFDARPQLSQTVFDLSAWKAVAAAKERVSQADAGEQAVKQSTALSVISLYLQSLELESRIEAAKSRIGSAGAVEKQVRAAYEAGTASKLDLSRAVLQVQSELAAMHRLEGTLGVTKKALLALLGQRENASVVLADSLAGLPTASVDLATAEESTAANPQLAGLRHAVSAARAETGQAKLQRLPRISFVADYGVNGQTPSASLNTYQYAGVVELPVFTSGRIRGEIKAAEARLRRSEQQLRAAELRILGELRGAFAEWEAARLGAIAARTALEAARENLDLSRARYEAGIADSVSVLQAQATLADIENLEIGTLVAREIARAQVLFAAGDVLAYLP